MAATRGKGWIRLVAAGDEVNDIINVTSILVVTGATASIASGTVITLLEDDNTLFATLPLAANSFSVVNIDTAISGIEMDTAPAGAEVTIFHR